MIFGFVRNIQPLLPIKFLHIIPINIIYIILAIFIDLSDEFNPNLCGRNIKISNNNKKITGGKGFSTCYMEKK